MKYFPGFGGHISKEKKERKEKEKEIFFFPKFPRVLNAFNAQPRVHLMNHFTAKTMLLPKHIRI